MDPIAATIVSGLLWLFLGSGVTWIVYLVAAFIFGGITQLISRSDGASVGIGVVLGWITAIAWQVFVIFQVVIHAVRLYQLASGIPVTV